MMATAAETELEGRVRACLRQVSDPCSVASGDSLHLEEMGLVRSVKVDAAHGHAVVDLRLTSPTCVMVGFFVQEITKLVAEAVPEIAEVDVRFDQGFDWSPALMSEEVQRRRRERFERAASALRP